MRVLVDLCRTCNKPQTQRLYLTVVYGYVDDMAKPRNHRGEHHRRNARARQLGFRNYYEIRKRGGVKEITRQSAPVLGALPGPARRSRQASLETLLVMRRERIPLARAASRTGVSPSAVRFWAGDALEPSGSPKAADRLLRQMVILSEGQAMRVDVRGSRQAAAVATYWNSVSRFLEIGDIRLLANFEGKTIAGHVLETDPDVLEELALAGGLQFEDIYALAG